MSARLGMDPGIVRGLADQLDRLGDDLTNLIGRVNGSVNRLGGTWHGNDFDQFAHTWHGRNAAAITRIVGELHQMATTARLNASEQEQASGVGDVASLGPGREGFSADQAWSFGSAAAGVGITLVQLGRLSKETGIPLTQWEHGVLSHLDDGSKLAKLGKGLGVMGVAVDFGEFGLALHDHASGWSLAGHGLNTGIDTVGVFVPEVALAKGAWDVGTTIGTAIANSPANQHVETHAVAVGASHIHGDPYTDPKAASDLVNRYKGVHGFFNAASDYFHAL
ncbi:MAG: WXG100 family type VII secretion target [Jatrophihabitans sp.]|uniref:WXG100 family type VII secretion target n=1 Tax=Jatrophihabitans sp. TaxID=1932789 RepID=UPI003F81E0BC